MIARSLGFTRYFKACGNFLISCYSFATQKRHFYPDLARSQAAIALLKCYSID
ncbi:hypothetical protein [Nostoc sp.]|uniref:hypothetical protein n=1 Tax=Nostoc sp. TaxID=1180 RepID=UPI002FF58F59